MFLLWECSTPFVFMRWVLHTLGRTKDKFYLYNGLTMMAVFFLCRNLLGVGARPFPTALLPCYACVRERNQLAFLSIRDPRFKILLAEGSLIPQ